MQESLLVGWAEVSITPDRPVMLAGQFFDRISEYIETPVTATALAMESGATKLVICSVDLAFISETLLKSVREAAGRMVDLQPHDIILCATHTHTSLDYEDRENASTNLHILEKYFSETNSKALPKNCISPSEAFAFLTDRIAKAIGMAWRNRKPAGYAGGFGRAAVGMSRRVVYKDGSAKMWGDTNQSDFVELESGNDSGIELLFLYDENRALTGVAVNIACPAQIMEHRSLISSDYWGKVKTLLREYFGREIFVLGLCSPAGDQCPRDMIRWVNPETPIDDPNIRRENLIVRRADPSMFDVGGIWKVGRRITNEIIAAYEDVAGVKTEAVFVHKHLQLNLPLRRVTVSEYEHAKKVVDQYLQKRTKGVDFTDNAAMHVHIGTLERYEAQQKTNLYPVEVHIARFDDIAFATNPFELFLNYGNQIRARSRAAQTFLVQLACGSAGYLPTKRAEDGGHYSAYISSGFVGHEGGEQLVKKTLNEINTLFE